MTPDTAFPLAPLQLRMLYDSMAEPAAGHHVEQVEIRFRAGVNGGRVISAWRETVAATDALRTGFLMEKRVPATPPDCVEQDEPASHVEWLGKDRQTPLLFPGEAPWRAVWRPASRTFVWTFHHALLDGRSIARVLRAFLDRLADDASIPLALPVWVPPSPDLLQQAESRFREVFQSPLPVPDKSPARPAEPGVAEEHLGAAMTARLEVAASRSGVSIATLVLWAWGRAVARAAGVDEVVVEQVRAGAPQEGTAGFTMNLLPLRIGASLAELRSQLVALREIETVCGDDLPPDVFPDVDGPWNSVAMIEHATLAHAAGHFDLIESVMLHEGRESSLSATAHLLPDLRLAVEGPQRRELLDCWVDVLEEVTS